MIRIYLLPLFVVAFLSGSVFFSQEDVAVLSPASNVAMCGSADISGTAQTASGKFVGVLPGWGTHRYDISSSSDSARFYFNQGLNMYYSYHMKEALASFREASRLDPGSAMVFWGQALTMGPYYNAAHTYSIPADISDVLKNMNRNAAQASPKELSLIKAMNARYPEAPAGDSRTLDDAYARELKALIVKYPQDPEIKVLYVDAVMLMHAWDFWSADGQPKTWTPEVVKLCEEVLRSNPEHPAALHYHIHLTEASRNPGVALSNADALKRLLPGVAHMVHMASHEYQRNGLYHKGVEVNDIADLNLQKYDSLAPNLLLSRKSPHYFAVQTFCAMTGGMYKKGMESALRARKSVSPTADATYDQYLFMLPEMTLVRLGKWEAILSDPLELEDSWHYAKLLQAFARGMAYTYTGKLKMAKRELASVKQEGQHASLTRRRIPFNSPKQMAGIAAGALEGAILFAEGNVQQAAEAFESAIAIEDQLIYTEPADWPVPVRQIWGAWLMKSGDIAEAEKLYQEDLASNPGNGWALVGLYQTTVKRDPQAASAYKQRYEAAFVRAETLPAASFGKMYP